MKPKLLLLVLIGVFLVSSVALADTIVHPNDGQWQDVPATLYPTTPGNPFWDNRSGDGTQGPPPNPGNIGYVLQSTQTGLPVPNLQYWSLNPNNTVDPNVTFQGMKSGQQETLILELAGNKSTNALYAYDVSDPTKQTLIFDGAATNPLVASINIEYANYGFVMKTGATGNGNFYSGNGTNLPSGSLPGHFAFFRDSTQLTTWWFGIEDLKVPGDMDFQDMIVKLQTQSGSDSNVPLPPSAFLLGSGLLGLLALRGSRRGHKS